MLAGPTLRVTVATTHVPLRDVPRLLTVDGIASTIWLTADALARRFGIAAPRVAVAGLNPHAGEAGRFGDEEDRLVRPAIDAARARIAAARASRSRSAAPTSPTRSSATRRAAALRRGRRAVPRPGADPAQAAALRRGGERHPGPAVLPQLARSRHRLRHRRQRTGPPRQFSGGAGPGDTLHRSPLSWRATPAPLPPCRGLCRRC